MTNSYGARFGPQAPQGARIHNGAAPPPGFQTAAINNERLRVLARVVKQSLGHQACVLRAAAAEQPHSAAAPVEQQEVAINCAGCPPFNSSAKRGPPPGFENVAPRPQQHNLQHQQPQQPRRAVKAGRRCGPKRVRKQQTATNSPFAALSHMPWESTGSWYVTAISPFAAFTQIAFDRDAPKPTTKFGPPPGFDNVVLQPHTHMPAVASLSKAAKSFPPGFEPVLPCPQHNLQQQQQQCATGMPQQKAMRGPPPGFEHVLPRPQQHVSAVPFVSKAKQGPPPGFEHLAVPSPQQLNQQQQQQQQQRVVPQYTASLCSSASDSLESLLACCLGSSDNSSSSDEVNAEMSEGCESEGEPSAVCVVAITVTKGYGKPRIQPSMLRSSSCGSLADLLACCMGQQH